MLSSQHPIRIIKIQENPISLLSTGWKTYLRLWKVETLNCLKQQPVQVYPNREKLQEAWWNDEDQHKGMIDLTKRDNTETTQPNDKLKH